MLGEESGPVTWDALGFVVSGGFGCGARPDGAIARALAPSSTQAPARSVDRIVTPDRPVLRECVSRLPTLSETAS